MDVDGNITPCCTLRRKVTVIAPLHPAVTSEENGASTISGTGETGTSAVSGAGDAGRCGATDSGKKNVCLRIVPVVVTGKGQHNTIVTNALLDPGFGRYVM